MSRAAMLVRRYPLTTILAVVVTVCFALQWFLPLIPLFQRQGTAIASGEWWRLFTSMLVQNHGWAQFLFNLAGIIVVGAAVERVRGRIVWVVTAVVAHVTTVAVASLWAPSQVDGGSSFVVGGFVGVLALARFTAPRGWVVVAAGYRVQFVGYLGASAVAGAIGGPVTGAIAGVVIGSILTGATVALLVQTGLALAVRRAVLVVTLIGTVVLIAWRDPHGVAVAVGMIIAVAMGVLHRH